MMKKLLSIFLFASLLPAQTNPNPPALCNQGNGCSTVEQMGSNSSFAPKIYIPITAAVSAGAWALSFRAKHERHRRKARMLRIIGTLAAGATVGEIVTK